MSGPVTYDGQRQVTKVRYSEWLAWGCDVEHVMGRLGTLGARCLRSGYAQSFIHLRAEEITGDY